MASPGESRLGRRLRRLFSPSSDKRDLAWWRERILLACLGVGSFFGFLVLIPSVVVALRDGQIYLAVVDAVACFTALFFFLSRRLSYPFRAGATLVLAYSVGIVVCLSFGLMSGGPAWLFFSAILAAVFFGLPGAIVALCINVASMTMIGWMIQEGILGAEMVFFRSVGNALVSGANYIFLNAVAAVSVAVLLQGLQEKGEQEEQAAADLQRERKELLEAKETLQEEVDSRRRIETALRESEERFREMAELMPETIYEMTLDGRLTYVNRSAFDRFGYSKGDFQKGLHAFSMIAAEDRPRAEKNLEKIISGERIGITEYTAVRKDGSRFPVMFHSAAIHREGKPVGLRGFIVDLTERKRLEEQFYQAQRLESIGTLAGGIAHDFNNLLMGIQGRASIVLADLEPSHPHHRNLKGIEEHVASAAHLTNQLLGFARAGKYEVRAADVNTLVDKTIDMFGRTRKEIRIYRKFDASRPTAEIDRGQIEQVLLNLLVNAWQAMPDGGQIYVETGRVCRSEASGYGLPGQIERWVRISITDTGTGMDPATRKRIFEPFFTTRPRGRGTGLGLATAYGIVRNHGGGIQVSSTEGKGSTFHVYLPESRKAAKEERSGGKAGRTAGGETVLLVDDEEMIRDIGRQLLERLGYRVITASGGPEALSLFSNDPSKVDLVILDMIMPGAGGKEVYDQLRAVDDGVRVLLSSGYSLDGEASEILRRGCDGFLQKPFDLEGLSLKVREILDRK